MGKRNKTSGKHASGVNKDPRSHEDKGALPFPPGTSDNATGKPGQALNIIADLRKFAEKKPGLSLEEARQLIHDLQAHQAELEMQNEELRKSQKKLEQSLLKYTDLYDNAPVGYLTLNNRCLILKANQTAAGQLGVDKTALIKKSLSRFVVREDKVIFSLYRRKAFDPGNRQTCEVRMKKIDGTEFIAELESRAVRDDRGGPPRINTSLRDVSRRRQLYDILQESRIRFKELFNNMSSGVAVYAAVEDGKDFIFLDLNRSGAKIDNVKKEDIIGKRITEAFPGVREFGLLKVFQRVWKTGTPEHHPVTLYKDDRLSGWRENYVYKLPSGDIVAIYDDVTERKKSEEKLRTQKEALERKNITLREMMEQIDIEKKKIQEDIAINVDKTLLPLLSKLKVDEGYVKYRELLKQYLEELVSSFGRKITEKSLELTPKEIEICNMIKGGLTSKDICNILFISDLTVEKHRRNIRRKLGLSNKKINLASYLHSL